MPVVLGVVDISCLIILIEFASCETLTSNMRLEMHNFDQTEEQL